MRALFLAIFIVAMALTSAVSAAEIIVPPTAKKLDAAGIKALYHGNYASFDNKQNKVSLTGEFFSDLDNNVMIGTYSWNNEDKGIFRGKAFVKGDKFCNKPEKGKQTCTEVFLDGKTFYEVGADGKVTSVDQVLDNPAKLPADAQKIGAADVLALVKGKRIFVTIFDFERPIVADIKWDLKKKRSVGKFMTLGTMQGKVNAKYAVKDDQVCWTVDTTDCYDYYKTADGFIEVKADGKIHAISKFQ